MTGKLKNISRKIHILTLRDFFEPLIINKETI